MVQDNHLSREASCFHWWVIFAVTSHVVTTNIFDRYVLDIEAHIVPRKSIIQSFMVYFNRLYFSCGRTVSELFVSIGHLSLIVKDWLMITVHRKTFRRKGECFVDHFFCVCVYVWQF
uniref:Uncharacterized protein n=1 Tax=Canis lupus familiaris TaxID=9615 RepID=A0A8C0MXA8_CANLF